MSEPLADALPGVGPVLEASESGRAVVAAIVQLNPGARVQDRGAYLRVSVPGRCVVTRRAIEAELGRGVDWPGGLEVVMPAFQGRLSLDEEAAEWRLERA
jgi:toluene monooxygenase system protein D